MLIYLLLQIFLRSDTLIETIDPDPYYKFMKSRGGMDFIKDFVRPGIENGVRLDIEHLYPLTIVTDRIIPENIHKLIGQIKVLSQLK